MHRILLIAAATVAMTTSGASAAFLALDSFDYEPVDSALSTHDGWGFVGTTTADPTIAAGSLSHPNRLPDVGNSVKLDGSGPTGSSKLSLSETQTSGTTYYSLQMRVSDIAGITSTTSGSFFAGFSPNTSISPTVTSVAVAAGSMVIHQDADNAAAYNLGVAVTVGPIADRQFTTDEFTVADTVFVVVGYEFGPGADDDKAHLWLNPDPLTYGALTAPAPNITSDGALSVGAPAAGDSVPLASFFLRNNSVEPAQTLIDDLRVATSWAEATSLVVPEPSAATLLIVAAGGVVARRRRCARTSQRA